MIDSVAEAQIAHKALNTIFFVRRINRLRGIVLSIISKKKKEENNSGFKIQKPTKLKKNPFSMITACLALLFLSACAPTHTAIIYCKAPTPIEDCIREDLGKKVKIVRVSKIDISTYMVDYK